MTKAIVPVLILATIGTELDAAQPQPRTRIFHFEYKAIVKDIPSGAKHVDLWVPVPHDDASRSRICE